MKPESVKGTPFDYSNDKITVYFEVADKKNTRKIIDNIPYINNIEELEYGFKIEIAIQQIPEIICTLSEENIAIYAVIPEK
ncbi:hypothetical protein [Oceanirhabdus sp. W0125-5]|uniref:hypothetical protein n=1 Tax=Oceanirhabdus sp. W0125-5 TaxID=2999116 RepID=UPI0022F2EDB3|nr:hypothetical protein [Oceanirhabdus sp. W0125-5]WBW97181.1 hypothetical protein OW730_26355 [Oceanirhabdus sp. W0125-5]